MTTGHYSAGFTLTPSFGNSNTEIDRDVGISGNLTADLDQISTLTLLMTIGHQSARFGPTLVTLRIGFWMRNTKTEIYRDVGLLGISIICLH